MDFRSFVIGPLLGITFMAAIIGILARITFSFYAIIKSSKHKDRRWRYVLTTVGRMFLPFYKAVTKKPFYAAPRYIFHVGLIVVPIWSSGHIVMLSMSRFGWYWTPLPDAFVDVMTLFLLGLAAFFFIRHIILADFLSSSKSDCFLIAITALPFLTGFIAYHQWLDYNIMVILHILSGEMMLIVVVFLFCRTRLDTLKCTGCAACALSCPTETLEFRDEGRLRIFTYSTSQCVWCGACVATCPEEAAELRHEISLKRFFQILTKQEIRSVELNVCGRCGCFFAPIPQLRQIGKIVVEEKVEIPALKYCDKCRKRLILDQMSLKTKIHRSKV